MANAKKKCKQCKQFFPATSMITVPAGVFCTRYHAVDFVSAAAQKATERRIKKESSDKKKADKAARAQHRADKQRIKPLTKKKNEAQAAINAYVRIRDQGLPCISCGTPAAVIEAKQGWKLGGCWDAGHFISRGVSEQHRFNLWNIHKQCKSCNGGEKNKLHVATVTQNYERNLRFKIGSQKVDFLKHNNNATRFGPEYLERIKRIFTKKAHLYKRLFR